MKSPQQTVSQPESGSRFRGTADVEINDQRGVAPSQECEGTRSQGRDGGGSLLTGEEVAILSMRPKAIDIGPNLLLVGRPNIV